ncbi:uncharacterized protein LOC107566375 [Colletotrichum higginsianum]|nr:uncharacterized protein LOC107566375 [Colletotrichum higginsianum]
MEKLQSPDLSSTSASLLALPVPEDDADRLLPAAAGGDLHDGAAGVVPGLEVDAARRDEQLEQLGVAVLDGLHDGVPPAVELEHLEDVRVVAAAPAHRLDDGQVLAGGVDVGAALLDEEARHLLVVLADGGRQGREDAAVLVLDRDARREEQLDALDLVRDDGALHEALEGARVGDGGEQLLEDGRVLDGHDDGPVGAADAGVGAVGEELVEHLGAVLADGRRQRRVAVLAAVVGADALVEEPHEGLGVVDAHGRLDDALGVVEVVAGGDEAREEVGAEVGDALEGRVLGRVEVRVGAVLEQQLEDVGAVVADRRAERRVDAVLLGVGAHAGRQQHADRLDVVDAHGQLHVPRRLLAVGAAGEEDLEAGGLVGGGPEHVLGAREVRVRAVVEQGAEQVDAGGHDGLEERRLALPVLDVGVGAVVEHEVDELLGRRLVHGRDEHRVAVGHDVVRVAAVGEQQVDEVDLDVDDGDGQRGLLRRAGRQVRVGAVLEQRPRHLERVHLDGGEERRDAVLVGRVGVGPEQQKQPDALGVLAEDRVDEDVLVGPRVGRHAAVQQLLHELVVLAVDGGDERRPEGRVAAGVVPRRPARHRQRVGLEADHLGRDAVGDGLQLADERLRPGRRRRDGVVRVAEVVPPVREAAGRVVGGVPVRDGQVVKRQPPLRVVVDGGSQVRGGLVEVVLAMLRDGEVVPRPLPILRSGILAE